jgi:hypothetical protein
MSGKRLDGEMKPEKTFEWIVEGGRPGVSA